MDSKLQSTSQKLQSYLKLNEGIPSKNVRAGAVLKTSLLAALPCVLLNTQVAAQIKTDAVINETDTHPDQPGGGIFADQLFIKVDEGFSAGGEHSGFTLANGANVDFHLRANGASMWMAGPTTMKVVGGGYPAMLTANANISAGNVANGYNTGSGGAPQQFFFTYNNQGCPGCHWQGTGEQVGYVGFSFNISGSTHYGFMELGITPDDNNGTNGDKTIRLIGIGYEQQPNTAINSILPVELRSVQVTAKGDKLMVNWKTVSEQNNAGFEVQRSTDNRNFTTIDFVEGKGTTDVEQSYNYADSDVKVNQIYYYRLRQIDFDGSFKYSSIVSAQIEKEGFVVSEFYPNPSNSKQVSLDINVEEDISVTAVVFDTQGKEVAVKNIAVIAGNNKTTLDLSNLTKGMYFAKISNSNSTEYRKIVIE